MKKILFFTLFALSMGYYSSHAQNIPVYHIPSYDVTVNGSAIFTEETSENRPAALLGKRGVNVMVYTSVPGTYVSVWIYSLDQETIYGPFSIAGNQPLSQPIDERQWGVLMVSEEEVTTDVWIE